MGSNTVRVSVCMATYNAAKHIKEQIDSILNQEFGDGMNVEMEIVVSDDGSTDDTISILEGYHDDRIKMVRHCNKRVYRFHNKLLRVTANFGNALEHASGDYVFLSDQDDVWHPRKIEKQLKLLMKQGGGVCAHSLLYIDERGRALSKKSCLCGSFWQMCKGAPIHGMSLAISRDVLDSILPMPQVPQHDIFISLWAKWNKKLYLDDTRLVAHRILDGYQNMSYTTGYTPWIVKVYYRLKIVLFSMWR